MELEWGLQLWGRLVVASALAWRMMGGGGLGPPCPSPSTQGAWIKGWRSGVGEGCSQGVNSHGTCISTVLGHITKPLLGRWSDDEASSEAKPLPQKVTHSKKAFLPQGADHKMMESCHIMGRREKD